MIKSLPTEAFKSINEQCILKWKLTVKIKLPNENASNVVAIDKQLLAISAKIKYHFF